LTELVDHLIPNQRVDRLSFYVEELESRLKATEESVIRRELETEEGVALAEDGFVAASRAITAERASYIASVVARGLTTEDVENNRQRYLLNLLSELNDEEILWLRFYLHPTIGGDQEFRQRHAEVFDRPNAYIGAPQEEIDKESIQDSYKEHLERVGLVKAHISIDHETNMPEFDKISGEPRKGHTDITNLGRMLLREIGMLDEKSG